MARSTAILGISHLVLAELDFDQAEGVLTTQGWRRLTNQIDASNPLPKAAFLADPMRPTGHLRLLAGPKGWPAVELIGESRPGAASTRQAEAPAFRAGLASSEDLPGWAFGGEPGPILIRVRCSATSLPRCEALWRDIGVTPDSRPWGAELIIPQSVVGAGASLRLTVSDEPDGPTWLDQKGLVCISFFTKSAVNLHRHLAEAGWKPGDIFQVAPLDRILEVFFLRGPAGELYEFLSLKSQVLR